MQIMQIMPNAGWEMWKQNGIWMRSEELIKESHTGKSLGSHQYPKNYQPFSRNGHL